jgi:hypothetical protein
MINGHIYEIISHLKIRVRALSARASMVTSFYVSSPESITIKSTLLIFVIPVVGLGMIGSSSSTISARATSNT